MSNDREGTSFLAAQYTVAPAPMFSYRPACVIHTLMSNAYTILKVFKEAIVRLVYKSGDKSITTNYRPLTHLLRF